MDGVGRVLCGFMDVFGPMKMIGWADWDMAWRRWRPDHYEGVADGVEERGGYKVWL